MKQTFISKDFVIKNWTDISPFFDDLKNRSLHNLSDFQEWLQDRSDLECIIIEDACWRQINLTRETTNENYQNSFNDFCTTIQPNLEKEMNCLDKKIIQYQSYIEQLDKNLYGVYFKTIQKNLDLFREDNVILQSEISVLQQQFGQIASKMSITYNEQEYTLQQAAKFLENKDREIRKTVFTLMQDRRLQDKDALNELLNTLIKKRNQIAINAGFANYRDYKFIELGRFDYSVADCKEFHQSIQQIVLPLVEKIYTFKKEKLQLSTLRPYDTEVDIFNLPPLKPCADTEELIQKTKECVGSIDPYFGDCVQTIKDKNHFDLESRKGKAPGGYNCSLPVTGVPFIFMNSNLQFHDMITMIHETGHAVHSFLMSPLPLHGLKVYPMEIAELASMSMELLSMQYWDTFFKNPIEIQRAKILLLERVLSILPWIALVDEFQHWIYENPAHTIEERENKWLDLIKLYTPKVIDNEGLEEYLKIGWQKQLHIFEVPFYYIEYGIAQLGAIAIWKNYLQNPDKTIQQYKNALAKGGSNTLPNLYQTAGIEFCFTSTYIQPIVDFVSKELDTILKSVEV